MCGERINKELKGESNQINKELKGESNQQVMRRRASLGCRVAGNDAGVWGAEARK